MYYSMLTSSVQTAKQIGYKGEIKGESAMVLYGDAGKVVEYKFAVSIKFD